MKDMHDDGLGAARGLLVAMALAVIGWGLLFAAIVWCGR
jgi:hypothetical protein